MKYVMNGMIEDAPTGGMVELPAEIGVYETLLVRGGRLVFIDEHWARLVAGAKFQGLGLPFDQQGVVARAQVLLRENGVSDGVCRFAVWQQSGRIEWRVEVSLPRPHMTRSPWRVQDGGAVLPRVTPDYVCKHLRRVAWLNALRAARAAGWDEVILSDVDGRVLEGGAANVFFVRGGVLRTSSLAVGPLPGVMRAHVLTLARAQGWPVEEGTYSMTDIAQAEEVWMTNSLIGIRPVALFAEQKFADETPFLTRFRRAWETVHGWDPVVVSGAPA